MYVEKEVRSGFGCGPVAQWASAQRPGCQDGVSYRRRDDGLGDEIKLPCSVRGCVHALGLARLGAGQFPPISHQEETCVIGY